MNSSGSPVTVLFLTKYARNGASSRYRTLQYLPYLEEAGFRCEVAPLFDQEYLEFKYRTGRAAVSDLVRAVIRRLKILITVRRYDLLVIEKELFPYCPAWIEAFLDKIGCPYVVDYDDALFHQYDMHRKSAIRSLYGKKISSVMRHASTVIAGNRYLAEYAQNANAKKIEILPTVVDLSRYSSNGLERFREHVFTVGWIGSPSTSKYLAMIASALREVCSGGRGRLLLIGSGPVSLPGVDVECVPWSEASEVELIRRCDVGVMPLLDSPWERGKCGLKLIQYMACGLPVVASPVGVNVSLVDHGVDGFLAADDVEWKYALRRLRGDEVLRSAMGRAGRAKVEQRYSLEVAAPVLASLLVDVLERGPGKLSARGNEK
jgi:glycosyltransferase involved in cell wall biosynthesis